MSLTLLVVMVWFIVLKRRTRILEDRLANSGATTEPKPELQGHSIFVSKIEAQDVYDRPHGSDVREIGVQPHSDGVGYPRFELH
jgi:hypothetical protein